MAVRLGWDLDLYRPFKPITHFETQELSAPLEILFEAG